jgi:hypothetical protein
MSAPAQKARPAPVSTIAHLVVVARGAHRLSQLSGHFRGHRIELVGTIQGDGRNVRFDVVQDLFEV